MQDNRSYFIRRAAQERSAATEARDTKVRAVHEDLAARYRELAHGNAAEPDQPAA